MATEGRCATWNRDQAGAIRSSAAQSGRARYPDHSFCGAQARMPTRLPPLTTASTTAEARFERVVACLNAASLRFCDNGERGEYRARADFGGPARLSTVAISSDSARHPNWSAVRPAPSTTGAPDRNSRALRPPARCNEPPSLAPAASFALRLRFIGASSAARSLGKSRRSRGRDRPSSRILLETYVESAPSGPAAPTALRFASWAQSKGTRGFRAAPGSRRCPYRVSALRTRVRRRPARRLKTR